VLYGFVPLETGIARDSLFLGLSRRCRESGFRLRKLGSFQMWSETELRHQILGSTDAPLPRLEPVYREEARGQRHGGDRRLRPLSHSIRPTSESTPLPPLDPPPGSATGARSASKGEDGIRQPDRRREVCRRLRTNAAAATSLLKVKIRQPSHEFIFGVGISFIPYPLVLTPVV
jgi:hypothetical protein